MKFILIALLLIVAPVHAATVGGSLTGNVTWTAAGGPYTVSANLTVESGATLTIQPGTAVYLGSGVNFTVANGGRLLAEGTEQSIITFSHGPGTTARWGGMTINGAASSPESRIAYAHFQDNGSTAIHSAAGTLSLDHLTFGTTDKQYVSLDGSSFLISNCNFPSGTTAFELVHGTGGIKAGGRGIVRECFFGSTIGYNDTMDFTGGNRPGGSIIQYYSNVFTGSSDDILDLDGTDAWIEGNIFLHAHKNGAPDTSSAVSGGNTGNDTSEITIIGNLFFDCDQAATAKQGNFFTLLNNTVVHMTHTGGLDFESAVVCVRDVIPAPPTTFGRGYYLEGNIVIDAPELVRNYVEGQTTVTFVNNILPLAWTGPGSGNLVTNLVLKHLPDVSETHFTSWAEAQVLRDWFSLPTGSPALGTGPNGRDMGGVIPFGVSISGEPAGTTTLTSATLTVGINRTGNGIPTTGFPLGSGYTHYKWRLDGGAWSPETPIAEKIFLTNLGVGPHQVEAIGKRDSGWYQDNAAFGPDAIVTASKIWTVGNDLKFTSVSRAGSGIALHFDPSPGSTYTVQYKNSLNDPTWSKLLDVAAQSSSTDFTATDANPSLATRFYRLISPRQP